MQYIMETIIIDLVKAKRPPHPMKRAIGWWNDALEDWMMLIGLQIMRDTFHCIILFILKIKN